MAERTAIRDHSNDLVIVSWHENGFWQADVYYDAADVTGDDLEQMGLAPDGFCTFSGAVDRDEAIRRARDYWPGARLAVVDEATNG